MNVVGIYAATCRCVLRARPEDPDSWSDLATLLPILRQALACCVCAGILNIPMAPTDTICQHHVCKDCIGGRMKVKPTCSWCKDWEEFVEKPQVRSLIQCFKGLCKYLSTSSISPDLSSVSNGAKSSLMTLVQEGAAIPDVFVPAQPDLSLTFLPVLPIASVVSGRPTDKHESSGAHQSPTNNSIEESVDDLSNQKEAKQQITSHSSGATRDTVTKENNAQCSTNCQLSEQVRSPRRKHKLNSLSNHKSSKKIEREETGDSKNCKNKEHEESVSSPSKPENDKPSNEKPNRQTPRSDRNIFQTVAAEHDYNVVSWATPESPRTRTRRASGYKSDDSTGPKSPTNKKQKNSLNTDLPIMGSLEAISPQSSPPPLTRVLSPQSQTATSVVKPSVDHDPKLSWAVKPRKRINKKPKPKGCRCGLATPNPGKLTCCGQRCPCYSAFKGCCPDCRCRGCRNPRKLVPDIPAPTPPPELFPPEATLTLTVNSESEDSEIEIDI